MVVAAAEVVHLQQEALELRGKVIMVVKVILLVQQAAVEVVLVLLDQTRHQRVSGALEGTV